MGPAPERAVELSGKLRSGHIENDAEAGENEQGGRYREQDIGAALLRPESQTDLLIGPCQPAHRHVSRSGVVAWIRPGTIAAPVVGMDRPRLRRGALPVRKGGTGIARIVEERVVLPVSSVPTAVGGGLRQRLLHQPIPVGCELGPNVGPCGGLWR